MDTTFYRTVANQVATATRAAEAGVVVDVLHAAGDLYFVIWAIGTDGRINEHRLCALVTGGARLQAHVEGFIANHLLAWKAAA